MPLVLFNTKKLRKPSYAQATNSQSAMHIHLGGAAMEQIGTRMRLLPFEDYWSMAQWAVVKVLSAGFWRRKHPLCLQTTTVTGRFDDSVTRGRN